MIKPLQISLKTFYFQVLMYENSHLVIYGYIGKNLLIYFLSSYQDIYLSIWLSSHLSIYNFGIVFPLFLNYYLVIYIF